MSDVTTNYFNLGLVLHGSLEDFKQLKEAILQNFPGLQIIYQTRSLTRLFIREESPSTRTDMK